MPQPMLVYNQFNNIYRFHNEFIILKLQMKHKHIQTFFGCWPKVDFNLGMQLVVTQVWVQVIISSSSCNFQQIFQLKWLQKYILSPFKHYH